MHIESWRKTITEYLGRGNLVDASKEPYLHNSYFPPAVKDLMSRDLSEVEGWAPLPGHDGVEFAVSGYHKASLRDAETGKMIGGYTFILPYIEPEYRGRGIMAALNKEADDAGHRFTTQNYTISGLMARAKTHALHVTDAVRRGEDVPQNVLEDYVVEGDQARLKEPMTRERYRSEMPSYKELSDRIEELGRESENEPMMDGP